MPKVPWVSEGAEKVIADWEKITGKTRQGTDAAKQFTKANQELSSITTKMLRESETGQEKYNRQLDVANRLHKAGKLSVEQLSREQQRLNDQLRRSESGMAAFGRRAMQDLGSIVTGAVSVTAAISVVRQELKDAAEDAARVTKAHLTVGQARDVLKRNIAGLPAQQRVSFEARAGKLAADLKLPQSVVDTALAESYSASGGDVEASFRRAQVAGQFLKTSPQGVGAFAGSLGDISKATGSEDDVRNLGFLVQVGAMSRVADAEKQASTIPQALASAKAFGTPANEGGALFAALSVSAADFQGDVSKTAVITASESLREFFDKQVKDKKFKDIDVDTFGERLAVLHGDSALGKQFAESGKFGRAQTKGPLQELFRDPNSDIAKLYRKNLMGFGTPEEQQRIGQETLGYLEQGTFAGTAQAERIVTSNSERLRLSQFADLTPESREEIIQRGTELTGDMDTVMRTRALISTGTSMSPSEAADFLEKQIGIAESPLGKNRLGADAEAQKLIDNTQEMIEELRALRLAQEDQARNSHQIMGRQE